MLIFIFLRVWGSVLRQYLTIWTSVCGKFGEFLIWNGLELSQGPRNPRIDVKKWRSVDSALCTTALVWTGYVIPQRLWISVFPLSSFGHHCSSFLLLWFCWGVSCWAVFCCCCDYLANICRNIAVACGIAMKCFILLFFVSVIFSMSSETCLILCHASVKQQLSWWTLVKFYKHCIFCFTLLPCILHVKRTFWAMVVKHLLNLIVRIYLFPSGQVRCLQSPGQAQAWTEHQVICLMLMQVVMLCFCLLTASWEAPNLVLLLFSSLLCKSIHPYRGPIFSRAPWRQIVNELNQKWTNSIHFGAIFIVFFWGWNRQQTYLRDEPDAIPQSRRWHFVAEFVCPSFQIHFFDESEVKWIRDEPN